MDGERLVFVLVKEGFQGLVRIASKVARLLLQALSTALRSAWSHRGPLTQTLLRVPAWLTWMLRSDPFLVKLQCQIIIFTAYPEHGLVPLLNAKVLDPLSHDRFSASSCH